MMSLLSSRNRAACSNGLSGLRCSFSSCWASRRFSSSEMPDLTHTFNVRHPRRLAAASRRAPQTRTPSGVMVTGWSSPSVLIEAINGSMSSLGFVRWRTPTTIESTLRSSSMWPPCSDMTTSLDPAPSLVTDARDLRDERLVGEQSLRFVADDEPEQHPAARRGESAVGMLVAEDDSQEEEPCPLVDVEHGLGVGVPTQGLEGGSAVACAHEPSADVLDRGPRDLLRPSQRDEHSHRIVDGEPCVGRLLVLLGVVRLLLVELNAVLGCRDRECRVELGQVRLAVTEPLGVMTLEVRLAPRLLV